MASKFDKLKKLVSQHESFWSEYAHHLPDRYKRDLMKSFYHQYWDPWYMRFQEVSLKRLSAAQKQSVVDEAAPGLSDIRDTARSLGIPVPELTAVSGWFDSLRHLLRSKEAKEMAPFIPYGPAALGTADRLATIISDAKDGNPGAVQTVKEIKSRSDAGDPQAAKAVETMKVISKNQTKGKSFYARGISVGHDPVEIGATRRHSSSSQPAPSGTAARVTDWRGGKPVTYYTPPPGGGANPYSQFGTRPVAPPPVIGPSAPIRTKLPPMPPPPQQVDPFAGQGQQPLDPFANPYGQYGQYPGGMPGMDPYGMYTPYDPYGYPFAPYGLPGLPPGYGYSEEPVIDRGGYQQYDAATDSFFSSNQKQVYDEATGMFYPVNAENPYAF